MPKIVGLVFLLIFFGGCAAYKIDERVPDNTHNQISERMSLVGSWHGMQLTKEGGTKEWLIQNDIFGAYSIIYKITEKSGKINISKEFGVWGVSGGIYFMITRAWMYGDSFEEEDPRDPFNYTAYKILKSSIEKMTYQSLKSGNTYFVRKVSKSFSI